MNMFDAGAVAVALAIVGWQLNAVGPWTSGEAQAAVVPQVGKVTVVSTQQSGPIGAAVEDFERFSNTEPFYGAYALTQDGRSGYTYGYNTLTAAKADAVKFCQIKNDAPCMLYATLEPQEAQTHLPQTLSGDAAQDFAAYQAYRGSRAFAVADNGAYGLTWEWDSTRGARREALAICASYAVDEDAADPEFTRCRVIDSH